MPDLKDFAKVRAWIDGNFMVYLTNIQKRVEGGHIPVHLLNEGLAGFTDGSGNLSITFGYVYPRSGPEFDFHNAAVEGGYHQIQISVGGKSGVFRGKFMDDDLGQSTDAATAGTASFMGKPEKMK